MDRASDSRRASSEVASPDAAADTHTHTHGMQVDEFSDEVGCSVMFSVCVCVPHTMRQDEHRSPSRCTRGRTLTERPRRKRSRTETSVGRQARMLHTAPASKASFCFSCIAFNLAASASISSIRALILARSASSSYKHQPAISIARGGSHGRFDVRACAPRACVCCSTASVCTAQTRKRLTQGFPLLPDYTVNNMKPFFERGRRSRSNCDLCWQPIPTQDLSVVYSRSEGWRWATLYPHAHSHSHHTSTLDSAVNHQSTNHARAHTRSEASSRRS